MTATGPQLDLFGEAQASLEELLPSGFAPPPPDFVERIRAELEATLATARRAELLPWPDLTRATLAELRFNSIAGWLPGEEAAALRAAFDAEMARLYEAEDERRAAAPASAG
jgi:hypothetical protein